MIGDIISGAAFAVLFLIGYYAIPAIVQWWQARRMVKPGNAILRQTINLLDDDPEGWTWDRYSLTHPTGLGIHHENNTICLPHEVKFGFTDRRKLRDALNRWRNREVPVAKPSLKKAYEMIFADKHDLTATEMGSFDNQLLFLIEHPEFRKGSED